MTGSFCRWHAAGPLLAPSDRAQSRASPSGAHAHAHLRPRAGETLHSLSSVLDGGHGRLALLAHLRACGVARVGERQAVANALGRAQRLRRLKLEPLHDPAVCSGQASACNATASAVHGALRGSFYASTAAAGDEAAGGPTGQAAGAVPVAGASSCSSSSLGCGPRNGQLGERSLPILSKIDFQASLDLVI